MKVYPYDTSANARALSHESGFARDVCEGLTATQKVLPAEYLYDEVGSGLFDVITLLPEYGLTRAEERLLQSHSDEIAETLGSLDGVVELGSGSGRKTGRILESVANRQPVVNYFAIDVSRSALEACRKHLGEVKGVQAHALECTYLDGLPRVKRVRSAHGRLLVLFLGSSIGNFSDGECRWFLKKVRQELRPGDGFLLGADLVKSPVDLLRAYDDPAGVTAAFNLNLLSRINRELDGDFRLKKFRHEVRWRFDERRIEMHLVSLERQTVNVTGANCTVSFEPYESIWTESSHKFTPSVLERIARHTGFKVHSQWIDEEWPFADSLWLAV